MDAKVLEYSEELIKILKDKTPIDQDDPNEVEIRCVSLHAIELLVIEVNKISDIKVTSVILDNIIWEYAMENFFDSVEVLPHHLTRTVFY